MKKLSKYTTELRYLIENSTDANGVVNVGLDDYPLFDELYRPILNAKLLNHYKFREIGMETTALFKYFLTRTMDEIMPYYNQLYKSELLLFNPLYDFEKWTETERNKNGTVLTGINTTGNISSDQVNSETETNGMKKTDNNQIDSTNTVHGVTGVDTTETTGGTSKGVTSDTPQGLLSIGNIEGDVYASSVDMKKSDGTNIGTNDTVSDGTNIDTNTQVSTGSQDNIIKIDGTNNNDIVSTGKHNLDTATTDLDTFTNHVKGNTGFKNYSQLLTDFRSTFLNIDMMVINDPEIQNLFMGVW